MGRSLASVAKMLQQWAERGDRNGCVLHHQEQSFAELFALLTEDEYNRFTELIQDITKRDGGRNPPCLRNKMSWPKYGNTKRGTGECVFLAWVIEALMSVLGLVPTPVEVPT